LLYQLSYILKVFLYNELRLVLFSVSCPW
jgi:hypothetical protein